MKIQFSLISIVIFTSQLLAQFQPQTKEELQTAVDLWVYDNTAALINYGEINTWDVSLINDMSNLFSGKDNFNDDISGWDVSNVVSMNLMFQAAISFNQDLSSWDVSNVMLMDQVFRLATSFNQDLSSWDVSNVTFMGGMFWDASSFNQDLSSWDVSNVTFMSYVFNGTALSEQNRCAIHNSWSSNVNWPYNWSEFCVYTPFTKEELQAAVDLWVDDNATALELYGHINSWNVSFITNMEYLFKEKTTFNDDINNWDVSSVTNMKQMFYACTNFNGDLSLWDVSSVTDMSNMFDVAQNFNSDISSWDVSSVSNMRGMFWNAPSFDQDIGNWDVSNVTDMFKMFLNAQSFDQDLSDWDVSNVVDMGEMFNGTQSLSDYNKCVIDASFSSNENWPYNWSEFCVYTPFTKEELQAAVDLWVDDNATALELYGHINSWNVSFITNMEYLFKEKTTFNDDINNWDVSSVTNMKQMFYACTNFNGDLSLWDVSSVTDMSNMFDVAQNFNSDISSWDVSSVSNMRGMFWNAPSFDQDIGNWDVSNVTDMFKMFLNAQSFDQDLSDWDVSNVVDMGEMFNGTQSLSDYNKCVIDASFSSNENWPYDWSESCNLSNETSLISPQKFLLHQNYPNPFNPTTLIKYDLPELAFVVIDIYDVKGRKIKNLLYNEQTPGYHSISWDATNQAGELVPAGLYIYSIQTGNNVQTKKMILVK